MSRPGSHRSNMGSARGGRSSRTGGGEINDQTLNRFLEIQSKVETYDQQGVFQNLHIAEDEFEQIEKSKRAAEINYKVLNEQLNKEKKEFDSISSANYQSYFKSKEAHNKAISKEQQEYMQVLNLFEIAGNELKSLTQQYDKSKEKLAKYKKENERAIELLNEQREILNSTYDGQFGSDYENKLENEVKQLSQQKDQLRHAIKKWSNSRFLLVHAYNQIENSERSWSEMMRLDMKDPQKVIFATEVRNNLVAANQNLVNTKSYLSNIDLPYCEEKDLQTLKSLASGTFQDMQTVEREQYSLNILQVLRKRCAALNQWFDRVINDTLVVDFTKVKADFDDASRELKRERIKLLQEKIKEKTGKDVKITNIESNNTKDTNVNGLVNTPFGNDQPTAPPNEIHEKPISNVDLPPAPSKDELLEQIKRTYIKQNQEWNKHLGDSKREADERLAKMLAEMDTKK